MGGKNEVWKIHGKVWTTAGAVKNHINACMPWNLRLHRYSKLTPLEIVKRKDRQDEMRNWEIIEVELEEESRKIHKIEEFYPKLFEI